MKHKIVLVALIGFATIAFLGIIPARSAAPSAAHEDCFYIDKSNCPAQKTAEPRTDRQSIIVHGPTIPGEYNGTPLAPEDDNQVMQAALFSCNGLQFTRQQPQTLERPETATAEQLSDAGIAQALYDKYCQPLNTDPE